MVIDGTSMADIGGVFQWVFVCKTKRIFVFGKRVIGRKTNDGFDFHTWHLFV